MTGVDLIADERQRQLTKLGWSKEHDQKVETDGQLWKGAIYYLTGDENWNPWEGFQGNIGDHRINNLAKAGALIAAEIDRLLVEETKKSVTAE